MRPTASRNWSLDFCVRTAVGYQPIVRKVKSAAGDRVLMIDPHTVAILRGYLATPACCQLIAGSAWPHTGFVFVRPNGQRWHPDQLPDRFERVVRDAGLHRSASTTYGTAPPATSNSPAPT